MISYGDCLGCNGHQCTVCKWREQIPSLSAENFIKNKAKPVIQYWCSECDALLNKYDKYCHNCGRAIDWGNL